MVLRDKVMELTDSAEQFVMLYCFQLPLAVRIICRSVVSGSISNSPLCIMRIHSLFYDHSEESKKCCLKKNEIQIWIFVKKHFPAIVLVRKI